MKHILEEDDGLEDKMEVETLELKQSLDEIYIQNNETSKLDDEEDSDNEERPENVHGIFQVNEIILIFK